MARRKRSFTGKEPSKGPARLLGVGLLAGAILGTAALLSTSEPAPSPCLEDSDEVAALWNDGRKEALAQAFGTSEAPYAKSILATVGQRVDRYVATWARERKDACLADRHREERLACAALRLTDLDQALRVLSEGSGEAVERALSVIEGLPPPSSCRQFPRIGSAAGYEKIARARALLDAGLPGDARDLAEETLPEIKAPALEAEAFLILGAALVRDDEPADGAGILLDALGKASAAGAHDTAAGAWLEVLRVLGGTGRVAEALMWSAPAQGTARHANRPDLLGRLLQVRGAQLASAGELDDALAAAVQAVTLLQEAAGEDDTRVARALDDLAVIHLARGEVDDAIKAREHAAELLKVTLGPDHPRVADMFTGLGEAYSRKGDHKAAVERFEWALAIRRRTAAPDSVETGIALNNLGSALYAAGDRQRAPTLLRNALAIFEARLGPDNPRLASVLGNIGSLMDESGNAEGALSYHQRALAILEKTVGPESPDAGMAHVNLGAAYRKLGRAREAATELQRGVAVLEKSLGPNHPFVAHALSALAQLHLDARNAAQAIGPLERAAAILGKQGDSATLARTRFLLARALWDAGRDRARATELARQAQSTCTATSACTAWKGELDSWLATRG